MSDNRTLFPCLLCNCPDLCENDVISCLCGHPVRNHRGVEEVMIRYCPVASTQMPPPTFTNALGASHFRTRRECGLLVCSHCLKANYLHLPEAPFGVFPSSSTTSMTALPLTANNCNPRAPNMTQISSVSSWTRPVLEVADSVNQRRMTSALQHQPPPSQLPQPTGVTQFPLFTFPTVSRPRVTARRANFQSHSSKSHSVRSKSVEMRFLICIHPQQIGLYANSEIPGLFSTLRIPPQDKIKKFIERAQSLNLLITHETTELPDTLISKDFDIIIDKHMREYGLAFVDLEETPNPSPAVNIPFVIDPEPKWQPLHVKMNSRKPDTIFPILHRYDKPVPLLTYSDIQKNKMPTVMSGQNQYIPVIIVPIKNIVVGKLDNKGQHSCLMERLWYKISDEIVNPPKCYDSCINDNQTENLNFDTNILDANDYDDTDFQPYDTQAQASSSSLEAINSTAAFSPGSNLNTTSSPTATAPTLTALAPTVPFTITATITPTMRTPIADQDEELTEIEDSEVEQLYENTRTMAGLLSVVLSDIHNDASNPRYLRITAPSPEIASEALFYHLRHLVIGSPVPAYLHPDAIVTNAIEAALSTSYIRVTIRFGVNRDEIAIGNGPVRTTWARLLQTVLSDTKHWVQITDGFFTPMILPVQAVSEADKKEFIFWGFLIRQCLIWGLDPLPISPFLLAFLFKDLSHAIAPDFIRAVAPKAATRLATWPPQPLAATNEDGSEAVLDLCPGKDPLDLIIQTIPHLQAAHIRSMSKENHEQLLPAIKAELLFAHQTMDIQNSLLQPQHPIFKSLMKGLNYPFPSDADEEVAENPVRLSEIFELNLDPIALLMTIYKDRTIASPSQLFPYFDWTSVESNPDDPSAALYFAREQRFKHLLRCYLQGVGHPPGALSVSQAAERDARNDTLLRARLFLETVTASVTLPWAHERISIIFKSYLSTPTAHVSGAHFHTCFKQVEFQVDDALATLADMGNAEVTAEAAAAFNIWIHSLLWNGTQVFNDA